MENTGINKLCEEKADVYSDTKSELMSKKNVETKSETSSEAKSETSSEAKSETSFEAKSGASSEAKSGTSFEAKSETSSEINAEASSEANSEINAELITKELYSVYLKCVQAVPVMVKDKESGKQVPSGIYQFDARCALKALQLLGDALGVFKEKSTQEGNTPLSYEELLKSGGFDYEF